LRHIIHDWPDAEALLIFQNVRKAMKPGSRLLIRMLINKPVDVFRSKSFPKSTDDFVLQYINDTEEKPLQEVVS
jgi:hypothetical protein